MTVIVMKLTYIFDLLSVRNFREGSQIKHYLLLKRACIKRTSCRLLVQKKRSVHLIRKRRKILNVGYTSLQHQINFSDFHRQFCFDLAIPSFFLAYRQNIQAPGRSDFKKKVY